MADSFHAAISIWLDFWKGGGGNRGERNEILFLSLVLFLWRLRLLFLGVYRMYYAEFLLLWHDEKKMLEKMAPKDV